MCEQDQGNSIGRHTHSTNPASKPIVLALVGWPSGDASGPVRSLLELADSLSGEFSFKVIARGGKPTFLKSASAPNNWERYGSIERYWCSMRWWGPKGLIELVRKTPHDIFWLNGFFDRELTIPALLARKLKRISRRPTILSIRGEFVDGALALKSRRKHAFLLLARHLRLHEDIWLHGTSPKEAEDICKMYPHARGVLVAPNVHRLLDPLQFRKTVSVTDAETLRIAFLSRIVRKKNLHYALDVVRRVKSKVIFDIIGPVEDARYWRECQAIVRQLPINVKVVQKSGIPYDEVSATLPSYNLMLLPTLGENFGHVIFEALSCGVPVLISNTTPWMNLEGDFAGWDLSLDNPADFARVIDMVATMDEQSRARLRANARARAERWVKESNAVDSCKAMLCGLLYLRESEPRAAVFRSSSRRH